MTGKTRVICFANNKGGSGKSTTCSNVGYGLTQLGRKVLLVDGDMQLNLSLSLFDEDTVLGFAQGEKNLYEGIRRQDDLRDYIVRTGYEDLDLIPSSTLMSSIEYELFTKWQREYILKKGLKSIVDSGDYDYILIDAPPTLGGWVMNILCASDEIIIPVEASPWGLFGLGNMFEFLEQVKEIAPDLKLGGILITKVDTRKNYFRQTLETLKELDDVKVFDTYIRVDRMTDPFTLAGESIAAVRPTRDEEIFQRDRFQKGQHWHTIEGASYFYQDGWHYCLFSGNCYEKDTYHVGYAAVKSQDMRLNKLHFQKYPDDNTYVPLLASNDYEYGTGHNSVIKVDGQWYVVYHGRDSKIPSPQENRTARICKLFAKDGVLTVERQK